MRAKRRLIAFGLGIMTTVPTLACYAPTSTGYQQCKADHRQCKPGEQCCIYFLNSTNQSVTLNIATRQSSALKGVNNARVDCAGTTIAKGKAIVLTTDYNDPYVLNLGRKTKSIRQTTTLKSKYNNICNVSYSTQTKSNAMSCGLDYDIDPTTHKAIIR
jgi:hypothetical protein